MGRNKQRAKSADAVPEGLVEAETRTSDDTLPGGQESGAPAAPQRLRQDAGPPCPFCQEPMLAGSTSDNYTRYYCRNRKSGCSGSRKIARPHLQAYIDRQSRRS